MRHYKTKLNVDIESTTKQLPFIEEIQTANLFDPSINYWERNLDSNSDNSTDVEIIMDKYLPDQLVTTDDSNNGKQQQRSLSFSEPNNIAALVSDLSIQNAQIDVPSQIGYDYNNTEFGYIAPAQPNYQTNENVFADIQTPFTNPSANMPQQMLQFQNTQQLIPILIPSEVQSGYSYSSDYSMSDSQQSTASTCGLSSVMATQFHFTGKNQNQTQLWVNSNCDTNYPCTCTYAQLNQLQDVPTIPSSTIMQPMPSMSFIPSIPSTSSVPTMPFVHPKLNDLNATITKDSPKKSERRWSTMNIPINNATNKSNQECLSQSLPNNPTEMTESAVAIKRRPKKIQMGEKEKRIKLETQKILLEGENQLLKSRVSLLAEKVSRKKDLAIERGLIVEIDLSKCKPN